MKFLIAFLICITSLMAQSEELIVDAKNFEADDKKGISTFTGDVKVKMGEDKLNAQKVDIFFTTSNKGAKTPTKYEATENVDFEIKSKDKFYVGKGDKIIYSPQKEEYTILGNAFVHEKNDDRKIYGDVIYVNQLTGEAKVNSKDNKPVRFIVNMERGNDK